MALKTLVCTLALVWVFPALYYNLDYRDGVLTGHNIVQTMMILGAALLIEASRHCERWAQSVAMVVMALVITFANSQVAFETISTTYEGRYEGRKHIVDQASQRASQGVAWSQSLAAAKTTVGDVPLGKLKSDLQLYLSSNARRWQATLQCNPDEIQTSKAFCAEVARLQGLVETGTKRDELQAKLESLSEESAKTAVPVALDAYAEGVANFLGAFGAVFSEDQKRALSSVKNVLRTVGYEGLATFGPMAHLILVDLLFAAGAAVASAATTLSENMRKKSRNVDISPGHAQPATTSTEPKPATLAADDPFHLWRGDCIEDASGEAVRSKDIIDSWKDWCARRSADPGTDMAFWNKLKNAGFVRNPGGGRPRWVNIKLKPKRPNLHVVSKT